MHPILRFLGILSISILLFSACGGEPAEDSAETGDTELTPQADAADEATEKPAATPTPAAKTGEETATTGQTGRAKIPADVPEQLLGTRWELVELEGKPVTKGADGQKLFIQLNVADDGVSGFTGCNTFTGNYELERTQLSFGPLASTRKACPGENPEQQFLKVLDAIEQFDITPNRLALSTGRSHGVAKFVAAGTR